MQIKSKRDVNRVTKSECVPDKSDNGQVAEPIRFKRETNEMGLGAPSVGAPFDPKPEEAEEIKRLVTAALSEFSEKPGSRKYG